MKTKLIIAIVIVALVIVLVVWYFYSLTATNQQGYINQQNVEQTVPNSNVESDSTSTILNDLYQVPSDNSLNEDVNSLNQEIESF